MNKPIIQRFIRSLSFISQTLSLKKYPTSLDEVLLNHKERQRFFKGLKLVLQAFSSLRVNC